MATRSHAVRLGGDTLGANRHVCGLFDGPADAADAVVPFVRDGIDAGERVMHIGPPAGATIDRLRASIDIPPLLASGQLVVRTWDEAYLAGGTFKAPRMVAYVRRALREGPALGFPGTRLIGEMEWAAERVPGVDGLVDYEASLAAILARPRVVVLCAYDLRRHESSRIAAVQSVHDVALVGGELMAGGASGRRATPRDRILAAAALLFAENGTSRTGVDALIEAAGVAKATFYRHFPSKDALIVAWLEDSETRWFDRVRAEAETRATTPADAIPRLFEAVADWLEADDFIGCPYLNTAIEISDPAGAASQVARDNLAEIGRSLEAMVAAAGYPDAPRLGRELHALLAGSIALGVANRTSSSVFVARDAALQLLRSSRV